MNISFEKADNVNALLTVTLEKADYEDKVKAALKDFGKKANMPGFRPGHAPMAILKKRFGTEILAEQVNKILGQELYKYIHDQKLNILGEPMPNEEKTPAVDFETMETFSFAFDVALAPEFDARITAEDKLPYYTISVDDAMVDQQVQAYCQRGGKHVNVDSYEPKDMVKGCLTELDEQGNAKEGGIQVEKAVMLPDYMKDEDEKGKFAGAKVDDVIVINPARAYGDSDVELSSLLNVSKEEAANVKSDFSLQMAEITRYEAAALDQALFDMVLGEGAVSSEEEFRTKIAEDMGKSFQADSQYKFLQDLRAYLVARIGEVQFPEAALRRIMKSNYPDKDDEYIEKNFAPSLKELLWHLIKEQLSDQFEVKVEQADVLETAKSFARMQFAQYGMTNLPDDVLAKYATEMLNDKKQVENLVARTEETKIAQKVRETAAIEEKTVSLEEFNKLFEEGQKAE